MTRRALSLALLLCTIVSAERSAFASDAGRLFDEGVKLLDEGKYAEACKKLEESQKLEPAAGTLLNLGACYERSGRRSAALVTFRDAAAAARARGRADWEKVAEQHVRELNAALPTLTVLRGSTPGVIEIAIDGVAVPENEVGVARHVDPGKHAVTAKAQGRKPYALDVVVRDPTTLTLPVLEPDHAEPGPASSVGSQDSLQTRHYIGLGAIGLGVAGLALGGVSALVAGGALDDAKSKCTVYPSQCGPDAEEPNGRAETWSSVATISLVAGGALAAAGAVLFLWPTSKSAPDQGAGKRTLHLGFGVGASSAFVNGRF